jgi:hypothetical protein
MQANQVPMVVAGVAVGVAVAVTVLSAGLLWETGSLRERLAEARDLGRTTARQLAALQAQQAAAETEAAAQRTQIAGLQSELDSLRQAALADAAGGSTPQPVRARIYSGGRYVGLGWVPAGGEPAPDGAMEVVLDGSLPAPAGVAEPAAAAVTAFSVAQQYPAWPYLWTSGWIGWDHPTNPPAPPSAGQAPVPPASPAPTVALSPPRTPTPATTAMNRRLPARRVVTPAPTYPRTFPQAVPASAVSSGAAARRTPPIVPVPRVAPTAAAARSVPGGFTQGPVSR